MTRCWRKRKHANRSQFGNGTRWYTQTGYLGASRARGLDALLGANRYRTTHNTAYGTHSDPTWPIKRTTGISVASAFRYDLGWPCRGHHDHGTVKEAL